VTKKEIEQIDNWKYEKELYELGYTYIGGTDEVGRGPLIGPVVAACCVLPKDFKLDGLTDSKKVSEKKREVMYDYIIKNCLAYGIGIVDEKEIDRINIYEASRKAMIKAIQEVKNKISLEYVLSDAMPIDIDIPVKPIIKGDLKSITISAASIIAKVTRDRMMIELDKKYPMYGFASHKGYPTKKHIEALNQYGLIDGYRLTYGPVKEVKNKMKG
jgi:ribonuclease HII